MHRFFVSPGQIDVYKRQGLQEPIGEGCMRVTTDDLVENA